MRSRLSVAGDRYQGRAVVDGLPDVRGHVSFRVTDDGGEFFAGREVAVGGRQCRVRVSLADNINPTTVLPGAAG